MAISFFELNNKMTEAGGNYDKAREILELSEPGSMDRAEKIFYFASNIEDDDFSLYAYNILKEVVQKELALATKEQEQYALLRLSDFYCEKYALPDDFEYLEEANAQDVKIFVGHLYDCFKALDGLEESDFKSLKYQFVFDYETDWLWGYIKSMYEKVKVYETKFGVNDFILSFFDEDNAVRTCLAAQILDYFKDTKVKEPEGLEEPEAPKEPKGE